ncbi:hypothetical protein DFH06DRAFT_1315598 [Mycena polygramma]|nr:hypothetical protein DFH06DRAFT_1315598 [Mycena polygramma]
MSALTGAALLALAIFHNVVGRWMKNLPLADNDLRTRDLEKNHDQYGVVQPAVKQQPSPPLPTIPFDFNAQPPVLNALAHDQVCALQTKRLSMLVGAPNCDGEGVESFMGDRQGEGTENMWGGFTQSRASS